MPAGRPTDYSKELAEKICEELAQGKSLRTVSAIEGMPKIETIFRWMRLYPEFCEQYAVAKQEASDAMAEKLADLGEEAKSLAQSVDAKASNAVVQAVKLEADNLKWLMSKMKPKKYGERLDMTTNGKDLPVPIISAIALKHAVQGDNGPAQDSSSQAES